MHYFFCPRCKFSMVTAKSLCPTCGYKVERKAENKEQPKIVQAAPVQTSLWSKILKWDFTSSTPAKGEQEKPAVIS